MAGYGMGYGYGPYGPYGGNQYNYYPGADPSFGYGGNQYNYPGADQSFGYGGNEYNDYSGANESFGYGEDEYTQSATDGSEAELESEDKASPVLNYNLININYPGLNGLPQSGVSGQQSDPHHAPHHAGIHSGSPTASQYPFSSQYSSANRNHIYPMNQPMYHGGNPYAGGFKKPGFNQPPIPRQSFMFHVVLACVVCWLCGWLIGIFALVLAICARTSAGEGRATEAKNLGRMSIMVSVAGLFIGAIVIAVVLGITLAQ